MDVCDPDAKTKNIRKLIKLHTGHAVNVSRERMCDITREAKKGNLPMPPLVLTRDKRFLLDSKSPLTQKDYETLYKSNTTSADAKRLAKKVGLVNIDKTIADLKDAIGRRLASTSVREPILLPGSRAVSVPKSENFFVNENRNIVQNENRNNDQNENRNNENQDRANINSARRNNGGRPNGNAVKPNGNAVKPNGNAVKPNGNRPKSMKNTIRNRHKDRIKDFSKNRREPNRREPNRREPNRREPNGKKPGFFGRIFGGSKNTSTNKLNTEMKLAQMKRNTQRQVSHQKTVQSRLRLREAKLAKNAISEAERVKRQAINDVTRMQNNKHLLEVELNRRASNSRKKSNEAAKARRELAKEKLHTGEMNMGLANLRRRLRTRDTSLTNALKNRDKLKKEFNEMKAGGDPTKIKEIQRKIGAVDGKIKTQRKKKDAAQTAITSMAKRIRNGAQSNVESLKMKIETKEKSKLSRQTAGLNFPDQSLLNKLKNDKGKAEQKLNRIKALTNDRGLLNSANASPEFRAAKDKEIAEAESSIKSLEDERKDLEKELAALKTAFSGQFSNSNRTNLQSRINAANKKIKNLEEELRKKPNKPNTPTPSPNKPNTPTPTPSPNKPNTPTPSPSPTNNNRIRKLEELMKLRSNLHVQVARARLNNTDEEGRFKNRINNMKNINQKGNIENAIKAAANTAKTTRNTKRATEIQRAKNAAAKVAKEAAELKANGNIATARTEAAKEAAAAAQKNRNEKRKQKFDNLLTQFKNVINNSQKSAFQQRFTNAQKARELPNTRRTNNQKGIIIRGGLAQIASELHKIKANKNEVTHKAAITRAKAAGSANEVAKQKDVYTQKRQASFNKMIRNAKNRHPVGTNQRPRLNTMITNLTTKFNRGQEERKKNGQQNQTIINAGKIPELAKAVRELENEFTQNQRKKNAQNIKNAQEKAKKAETNRNQAQIQSKKYKEQSQKYKNKTNSLLQQRRTLVGQRNVARQELGQAKKNLATASTQSEKVQIQAKANLEAARTAAKAAQNELAKSKNASKLANKKRELTNLAREQRVLQNLELNNLPPGAVGPRRPRRPFSTIINGLTVNDLANGGLAGKLPNQIKATGTVKKANQNAKKKADMEAAVQTRQEKQETKRKQREAAAAKAKANQEKREQQKGSVIKSIKNAQNASKAKEQLRQRLTKMKTIITEKRAKENANRLAREKANKAAANKAAKIKEAVDKGQRKKEITKLLNNYNNRLGSKKWPETKGTLLNEYMKSTKNLEQDKANLEALLKRKVKNAANKAAANKKVVSNLVGTAIKKATNNELVNTRLAYRTNVLVATREGRLPQNQKTYWYDQATTATTMNMIKGVDKMFKIHLEKLKREKNAKNKKPIYNASNSPPIRGDPRKGANPSGNGVSTNPLALEKKSTNPTFAENTWNQDMKLRLKKHISGKNVMASQTIPGFNGKRVENEGYESGWLNRVDKEGDTAVKRAKLKKMFDDKFELRKTLLKHESTNVRTGYRLQQLQSLKRQVMRPFSKKKYDSTKGTNKNEAILNAARIEKQIEEATSTHANRILKQQPINMKKAGQKFKRPNKVKVKPQFSMVPLGEGRNKAINGVNITLKKAEPVQGPTVMKLGVQAAVAKNKLGKTMTNVERRVAARKAAEATGRLGGRMAQQRNNTFRTKGMTAGAIAKASVNRAKKAEKIAAKRAAKKAK